MAAKWETLDSRAFACGMGYCTQYNLVLAHILNRLGLVLYSGALEWQALLAGSEPPAGAYKERATYP